MDAFNNNGTIRNKDGHSFNRSTGTWENQNAAENPDVVKEDPSNPNNQDTTTEKKPDTTTQQTDTENKNSSTQNEKLNQQTPEKITENIQKRVNE